MIGARSVKLECEVLIGVEGPRSEEARITDDAVRLFVQVGPSDSRPRFNGQFHGHKHERTDQDLLCARVGREGLYGFEAAAKHQYQRGRSSYELLVPPPFRSVHGECCPGHARVESVSCRARECFMTVTLVVPRS